MDGEQHQKIVLTGGPGAGKTTISEVLHKAFPHKLAIAPEAASLLMNGGFPKWPEKGAKKALQKAIYTVQCRMEEAYCCHFETQTLILDRGTVDGAAYWPDGPDSFFEAIDSSLDQELARYSCVIYLESADQDTYKLSKSRNPLRCETWAQAKRLDEKTRILWAKHPKHLLIKSKFSFSEKIAQVLKFVEREFL